MKLAEQVASLEKDWAENPRWKHVKRPYSAEEVVKLRVLCNLKAHLQGKVLKSFGNI